MTSLGSPTPDNNQEPNANGDRMQIILETVRKMDRCDRIALRNRIVGNNATNMGPFMSLTKVEQKMILKELYIGVDFEDMDLGDVDCTNDEMDNLKFSRLLSDRANEYSNAIAQAKVDASIKKILADFSAKEATDGSISCATGTQRCFLNLLCLTNSLWLQTPGATLINACAWRTASAIKRSSPPASKWWTHLRV
jgi:hypothetical protein